MTWVKPSFRWLMHRSDWARIEDLTPLAREVHATRDPGLLPPERPYPVPAGAAVRLAVS